MSQKVNKEAEFAFDSVSKLPLKSLSRFTCAKKSQSLLFQIKPSFCGNMDMFRTNFVISKHDEGDNIAYLLLKENRWRFPIQESLCIRSHVRFENRIGHLHFKRMTHTLRFCIVLLVLMTLFVSTNAFEITQQPQQLYYGTLLLPGN